MDLLFLFLMKILAWISDYSIKWWYLRNPTMLTNSNVEDLIILIPPSLEQVGSQLDHGIVLVDDLVKHSPEDIKLYWFGHRNISTSTDEHIHGIIISWHPNNLPISFSHSTDLLNFLSSNTRNNFPWTNIQAKQNMYFSYTKNGKLIKAPPGQSLWAYRCHTKQCQTYFREGIDPQLLFHS